MSQYNFRFANSRYPLSFWMRLKHVKQMMAQNKVSSSIISQHEQDSITCSEVQAFSKTHQNSATANADMDYQSYGGQQVLSEERVEEGGEILIKTTFKDGDIEYTNQDNQVHRTTGPAIIKPDGRQFYYQKSLWHRIDGPARIRPDGTGEYYINGKWVGHFPKIKDATKKIRQLKESWS